VMTSSIQSKTQNVRADLFQSIEWKDFGIQKE
jgi:hypothetical protein